MTVSSVVGKVAFPISGWYAATKHALEALSDALRLEVAPFGIDVVIIEPGPIATEFLTVAESTTSTLEGDVGAYESIMQGVHEGRKRNTRGALTAADCAAVMMKAAAAPSPCARYPVTMLAWIMMFLRWLLPTFLMDAFMRRVLDLPGWCDLRGRRRSPHQDVTF
jgi:short-subunit dehydrogenase